MSQNEPGRYDICPNCKAGMPLRWRGDTQEWIHEHVLVDSERRSAGFRQVFCTASDLRKEDGLNG